MSDLPKIVRARLGSQLNVGHPDANVLTAFYEQLLPESERGPVLAHLSHCAECREVVALALPPETEAHVRVTREPASLWNWPLVRWASLAACLVVVGAAVLIHPKPGPDAVRPSSEAEVASVERSAERAAQAERADIDDKVAAQGTPPAQQSVRVEEPAKKQKDATASVENRVATPPLPRQEAAKSLAQPTLDETRERDAKGTFDRPAAAPSISGNMRGSTSQPASGHASAAMAPAPAWKAEIAKANEIASEKAASEEEELKSSEGLSAKAQETPGRAKAATGASGGAPAPQSGAAAKEALAKQADVADPSIRLRTALVMLSSEGQLQRSFDSGATWEPVPVVERVKFTALSVVGRDVWAGGAAGLLYHSTDSGNHWTPVKPSAAGAVLSADINGLHFTDAQQGTLTTSDGQHWSTADGGRNWQKTP
jgi:Photosynthesis system II assembly factor YCF48